MMDMTVTRASHRPVAGIAVLEDMVLAPGRCHEFCGTARRRLALMVAARVSGPVIWIRPAWMAERLNPDGVLPVMDPGRLVVVTPGRAEDLLWCMEEALRSGAVSLVVAELPKPPAMTPVRRLHLAAEAAVATGAGTARPVGLILTPGAGGAPGVESRWSLDPAHGVVDGAPGAAWHLERRRARMAPPKGFSLVPEKQADLLHRRQDATGARLRVETAPIAAFRGAVDGG